MSEGFSGVFRGIRPVDWVLAGALTALGVWLMVENVLYEDAEVGQSIADGSMVHAMSSHSWGMVPVFALATIPVLWWRRNVIAVTSVALVVMVLHDLVFGWVTRCGAGLPLAFVLVFLGGFALERGQRICGARSWRAAHDRGPRARRDHWPGGAGACAPDPGHPLRHRPGGP